MKLLKTFCGMLIICSTCSCVENRVYYASQPIHTEWEKRDTLVLQLHLTDSLPDSTEVALLIRNRVDYPYLDFTADVICNVPDSTQWATYNVSIELADQRGNRLGKGWSNLFESSKIIIGFSDIPPGIYTFKIAQQMNNEPLTGVHDVGIMVRKRKCSYTY